MQHEPTPKFTIHEMTVDMIEEATEVRLRSWLDTYVNDALGVTREWIEARNAVQRSDEKRRARFERFVEGEAQGTLNAWVAFDTDGNVIGSTTPFINDEGTQHVGSLYVDKAWHGAGVGSALMQQVINWFDPKKPIELGVVTYNERAKAFYRKWGFVEIPGSDMLFDNKIPEVRMVRKGDKQ